MGIFIILIIAIVSLGVKTFQIAHVKHLQFTVYQL